MLISLSSSAAANKGVEINILRAIDIFSFFFSSISSKTYRALGGLIRTREFSIADLVAYVDSLFLYSSIEFN